MTEKKNTRTRKTAAKPVEVAPVETVAEPVVAPAQKPAPARPTHIDLSAFWQMQHAAMEAKLRNAEAEAARLRKLYILAMIDAKGRVTAQEKAQDEAKKQAEVAENRRISLMRSLERRLGCELSSVGIEPNTGEIQYR